MTTYNETALLKTVEIMWGKQAIPIAQHIYSVIDQATKDAFQAGYQKGMTEGYADGIADGERRGRKAMAPREFYGDVMDSTRLGKQEICGGLCGVEGCNEPCDGGFECQHDSGDENDFFA